MDKKTLPPRQKVAVAKGAKLQYYGFGYIKVPIGWLLHGEDFGGDVLAVAAPGEGAHIAFPTQFYAFARATHKGVCHGLVGDGEFELVAAESVGAVVGAFEAALYHLPFVGFEDNPLLLEVVDVAGVDARAVDEEEVEIDEQSQCDGGGGRDYCDDFCFGCHFCHRYMYLRLYFYLYEATHECVPAMCRQEAVESHAEV